MIPLRKHRTGDRNLDQFQDAVDESLRPLQSCPLVDGVLLTDVAIPSGSAATVPHLLDRKPRGWFLVSPSADVRVWQPAAPTGRYLYLQASAALTGSIWVF